MYIKIYLFVLFITFVFIIYININYKYIFLYYVIISNISKNIYIYQSIENFNKKDLNIFHEYF